MFEVLVRYEVIRRFIAEVAAADGHQRILIAKAQRSPRNAEEKLAWSGNEALKGAS